MKNRIRFETWKVANVGKSKSPIHGRKRPQRVATVRNRNGQFAGPSADFKGTATIS